MVIIPGSRSEINLAKDGRGAKLLEIKSSQVHRGKATNLRHGFPARSEGKFSPEVRKIPTPSERLAYSIYQLIRDFRSIHIRDYNHIIYNTNAKSRLNGDLEDSNLTQNSQTSWDLVGRQLSSMLTEETT